MIDVKSLRIGNWVNGTNDFEKFPMPLKVQALTKEKAWFSSNNEEIELSFDRYGEPNLQDWECYPIPLSQDILEKAGLKDIWIKESWKIVEDISDGELYGWGIKVRNANHTREIEFAYFKYVHQLQNLYYSLTNQELTINI